MINAISIALSGLTAASRKVDTAASNIANVSTGGALNPSTGGKAPYSALGTTQTSTAQGGVVADVRVKQPGYVPAYDPNSPFANADGEIGVPNVSLDEEAVNLKLAETTYKANIQSLKTSIEMSDELFKAFDKKA
jgi:flagellar basal-body rod protein FlgC